MKKTIGFIAVFVIFLTNCGSSSSTSSASSTPAPQVSVAISPSAQQTIDQGQAVNFTSSVTNDTNSDGVSWSLSGNNCTGSACGALSNTSTTAATYTAPASVSSALTVTVEATSIAKNTVTASTTVVVDPAPAITTTTLAGGTVGTAYSETLAASGGTGSLSWSVTTGSLPAGLTLEGSMGVISGTPTASGTANFTVQVTDSAATPLSAQQQLSINVVAPTMAITTTSLPDATVGVAYNGSLQVSNATQPVTWSISSGTLPNGLSLDPSTGAISGTPTTAGTSTFTVMVTDSTTPTAQTATQSLSITANASGANDSIVNGHYAFLLSGYDSNGNRIAVAGSFQADGSGGITNGVEDINHVGSTPQTNLTFSGTYALGTDNRGTITITNSASATYTMAIAMGTITSGTAHKGAILEFDSSGYTMSGTIGLQDTGAFSAAALTGNYAFGLTGADTAGSREGVVGEFAANGSGGITGGLFDANDNGVAVASGAIANTSTYTVDASSGRGAATLTGLSTADYAFYIVSASKLLAISVDPTSSAGLVIGEVDKQSGGSFSSSSLNGTEVLSVEDEDNGSSEVGLGLATFDGSGNLTNLSIDDNDAGNPKTITGTGTYTVDSTGRFTLAIQNGPTMTGYLSAANQGFFLDAANDVLAGTLLAQSGGPFTNASLSSTLFYGSEPFAAPPATPPQGVSAATLGVGVATPDGAGNLSVTLDTNSMGTLQSAQTNTDTYSVSSSGRVTLGSGTMILYIVSPTKVVMITTNANDPNPTLGFAHQ